MAIVSNLVWIEKGEVPRSSVLDAREALTLYPRKGPLDESPPKKIIQYLEEGTRFGVPFAFADSFWPKLKFIDKTVIGKKIKALRFPNPNHSSAPPGQDKFFDDMLRCAKEYSSVLAVAPTGAGKTVALLNTIGKIGRTALVVVPSAYLADQWREEAIKHLGFEWKDIGVLQGDNTSWEGKSIVIAVIHNLFLKEWSDAFLKNFGIVVWDEAHKLGARVFSSTMSMFHARVKLAVTATPDRKDGCAPLYTNFFGKPLVVATSKALATTCYVIPFPHIGTKHYWIDKCKSDARPMKWLAGLKKRNEMIANLASELYFDGREVLIVTKFIEHTEEIKRLIVAQRVRSADIGLFTRTSSSGSVHGRGFIEESAKRPIIIATYAMMKEGVDIPRLDTGIEALPTADGIQVIGRIRRPFRGKRKPKWFTISDLRIPLFERYTKSRLNGFTEQNVTIKELQQGVIK
jgi:superfamily II DNA or RNA helicase